MSDHPKLRSLFLRSMYPIWHRDEMVGQPPAFGVRLAEHLNDIRQPVFVCEMCGQVFADRCSYVLSASTAAGVVAFCRCTVCAAEHNYRTNRGNK